MNDESLVPYAAELYDKAAYARMRAWREPFIVAHTWAFYALLIVVALHLIAVIVTEVREGGAIISAMFTGRKTIAGRPIDKPDRREDERKKSD